MTVVILSLIAAGAIGAADFLGGLAGRTLGYRQALVIAYGTVAGVTGVLAPAVGGRLTS